MGAGLWARRPRCFPNQGIPGPQPVTLAPQVNCLACAWDLCSVYQVFLERGIHTERPGREAKARSGWDGNAGSLPGC